MAAYYRIAVCHYKVERDVVLLGVDFVDELEFIAYAYCQRSAVFEQAVVIALPTADAVPVAVECSRGDYHEVDFRKVHCVVAGRLLDTEGTEVHPAAFVGQDFEVESVDARQEEFFLTLHAFHEFYSG